MIDLDFIAAGPELDALVGAKVPTSMLVAANASTPSVNLVHAWQDVVEPMAGRGYALRLNAMAGTATVAFEKWPAPTWTVIAEGLSDLPRAICVAALKAVRA